MAHFAKPSFVLGCDVGEDTISTFNSRTREPQTLLNGGLLVCEATGGYEATLLAAVLRLASTANAPKAAALAGLAPHPCQSGQTDNYRRVRGGRRPVKTALFMAAMAARRFNPDLKAFYERLIAGGKKRIVAIIAVARKLITIINARIGDACATKPKQLC